MNWGATALATFNDNVYFMESPTAFFDFEPRNDEFDDDEIIEMRSEAQGYLQSITPQGEIETIGNLWYEGLPYRSSVTKMLSFNNTLNMMVASDSPDTLLDKDAAVSHYNNMQWLTWTNQVVFNVDIPTRGSSYNALVNIAQKVGATFAIDRNIIKIQTRSARGALVNGALAATDTQVAYDNANRAFPSTGHIVINNELMAYTGRTDTHLTGLDRGLRDTTAADHADNSEILYIDAIGVIETKDISYRITTHWTHLFNKNVDADERVQLTDKDSIAQFQERTLSLDLGLTLHESLWIQGIAKRYLERLKDERQLFHIVMQPVFDVNAGDVLYWDYNMQSFQVLSIAQSPNSMVLIGRQVEANIIPEPDPYAVDPNDTFLATDGVGDPIVIDGVGDRTIFLGDERYQTITLAFASGETIPDQMWTQYQRITPFVLPKVESEGAGGVVYTLETADGIVFDALTFEVSGTADGTQPMTQVAYTATDIDGNTATLTFNTTINAAPVESMQTLDGVDDPILIDGVGDRAIFGG